ncbi:2'-5' RNA ligase family protein [Microbacteriaceae bacterium 4G12]
MYAVIALFDEKTENTIQNIWNELYETGLSYYSKAFANRRPHITIASYQMLNKEPFMRLLHDFCNETESIPITLSTLGTFLQSKTVFLSPTPTKTLFDWHFNYHEKFKNYHDTSSLYVPEKWIPHCTIANHLTEDQFQETFQYCADKFETLHAHIKEITLIELEYINRTCIDAPIIFSKKLINKIVTP